MRLRSLLISLFVLASTLYGTSFVSQANALTTANCPNTFGTSGNVVISVSGNDCILTFTNDSTWTIPTGVTSIRFLIVGGGAAGYNDGGGGGGGGGGVTQSGFTVTPGTVAQIDVGPGGNGDNITSGTLSRADFNNDGTYELSANGGSLGTGWSTRTGGNGGAGNSYGSASTLTGGGGGAGPTSTSACNPPGSGGSDGFSSDISGSLVYYGGGGGGGIGSQAGGSCTTDLGPASGGKGGGGAGAAQRAKGTNVTYTYLNTNGATQTITARCEGANYAGSTTGFDGQANYGGGGGGGSAYGDGCNANPATNYDGDRNRGGFGGFGVVIVRYAADITGPTITGPASATGATSSISIPENSTVVHSFTANETVSWTKSGTDSSFFTINSSGVLTITSRDFETRLDANTDNVYVVVITATDNSLNATTQTLSVTITNVNEAPQITINSSAATYSVTQAENISSVLTYTASDVDAGTVFAWSLSGTDAADFTIGSSTGILAFATNPDYEGPSDSNSDNIYSVVVTVSDGALTDTQTITITITNANESGSLGAPTVSGNVYKGVITTITVSSNSLGRVLFKVDGKRIPNCLSRPISGTYPNYSATCSWKPTSTAHHLLTASLTPSDNTFSATTSDATTIFILKRGSNR